MKNESDPILEIGQTEKKSLIKWLGVFYVVSLLIVTEVTATLLEVIP